MAVPSPYVYLNSFINSGHIYSNQRSHSNSIPQMSYIPFALKLAALSYACSSWTKASLILQQQFQIITTKSILTENEKKIVSGFHISITYLLLRFFHQKSGTLINLKEGGRFEKLNLFSSKLLIPLIIGLIICAVIEESGLLLLLQITSGSRRVYSISGKNAIKVEGFRDEALKSNNKKNNNFKKDIENKSKEEEKAKNEILQKNNNEINRSNDSLSIYSNNKHEKETEGNEEEEEEEEEEDNKKEKEKEKEMKEEKKENTEYTEEKEGISKKEKFYHDDCCVCLGSCEYPQMETFCASETHVAHSQCMLKWLQASKKRQCPLCRQPLQVSIISESMHDYIYGYPPLYKIIQRNIDWKCFLKRTGITLSVTISLLLILKLRMMTTYCKYNNLRYSSSA
jgi:hypothetical protein